MAHKQRGARNGTRTGIHRSRGMAKSTSVCAFDVCRDTTVSEGRAILFDFAVPKGSNLHCGEHCREFSETQRSGKNKVLGDRGRLSGGMQILLDLVERPSLCAE